jgi:hypothetical protein
MICIFRERQDLRELTLLHSNKTDWRFKFAFWNYSEVTMTWSYSDSLLLPAALDRVAET